MVMVMIMVMMVMVMIMVMMAVMVMVMMVMTTHLAITEQQPTPVLRMSVGYSSAVYLPQSQFVGWQKLLKVDQRLTCRLLSTTYM